MLKAWFVVLIILLITVPVRADVSTVTVLGLFNGMAVLNINDQQRILKTGKTSSEGVTLISANAKQAVLEIDGIQETYYLASHIGSRYIAPAKPPAYCIWAKNGLYTTPGLLTALVSILLLILVLLR